MSCEENRIRYFERVSAAGSALAGALGGESEASAALEQIFNTARNDGAAIRSPLQQHKAAARTLQLFEEMEKRYGLARPTHSRQGMRLPRRDAQFGYQAVYDTIEAARTGRALPDVATHVLRQRQTRRTLSSVRLDDRGYYRCSSCGQFASRTRAHICPFTATSADLERTLQRRLGVPSGAYAFTDSSGQRMDGLQQVIDAARSSPTGTARMIHCLTGEEAMVTLDGTIPALCQGFVPDSWVGRSGLQHVELPDRRVVAVLDASGLNAIDPTLVLGPGRSGDATKGTRGTRGTAGVATLARGFYTRNDRAVEFAAAAYGAALAPGTYVYSLGSPDSPTPSESHRFLGPEDALPSAWGVAAPPLPPLPPLSPLPLQGSTAMHLAGPAGSNDSPGRTGNAGGVGISETAATSLTRTVTRTVAGSSASRQLPGVPSASKSNAPGVPGVPGVPGAHGTPVVVKPTFVQGGTAYDWGHFIGTEYRKGGSRGVAITACGRPYRVGERSTDPTDWSHARRTGAEPAPKGGVAVGRTLVPAIDLLSTAQTVTVDDETQLYNTDGSELVAVYDNATHTAGDTLGTPNASPEQMAALLAYWEHVGRARRDSASPVVRALVADLDAVKQGSGSPLAAADSAYLVLRDHLRGGNSMTLGARVSTPRCPDCGRWMGDTHNCPVRARADLPAQIQPLQPPTQPAGPKAPPVLPLSPVSLPQKDLPEPSLIDTTPAQSPRTPNASPGSPASTSVPEPQAPDLAPPSSVEALEGAFEKLGDRLGDRLGQKLGESLGESLGSVLVDRLESLKPPDVPLTSVSPPTPSSSQAVDERMILALDRLAAILQERKSSPTAEDSGIFIPVEEVSGEEPHRRRTSIRADASGTYSRTEQPDAPPSREETQPSSPAPSLTPLPPSLPPLPPPRPPLEEIPLTPQEHILKHVRPPELPDPYLTRLDASLGGQRTEPLRLHYEEIDPVYDVSEGAEKALRIVSSSLQMAWDPARRRPLRGTQMRVFGFAGTAGTGKNTTARQIAAALRLPYYETTLHRDTSLQEEIGQTVLKEGTTVPKLGPLGQAAAAGGVICINELVKANPGTLGALQRMMEDGVFEVQGTEAGIAAKEIPVHPSTVFICTWNPGYDGSSDRPDAALLSRIPTIKMDAPDVKDETRRLVGSLAALFGVGDEQGEQGEQVGKAGTGETGERGERGDGAGSQTNAQRAERAAEIFGRDYLVRKSPPSPERVEIAVRFVRDLRNLAQTRQIGASSRHLLEPTPREALHFAAMCEVTGDPRLALEQFKIYCDSGEGYDEQFKLVQQIFKRYYGEDGQALNRRANGEGPQAR